MKRSWILLVLLLAFDALAIDVQPTLSGSWYNPAQSGHGFSVEVLGDGRSVVYWYVYDHDRQPIFLIAIGDNVGSRIVADVYYHDGMKFGEFNKDDVNQVYWGTLTLEFLDCQNAVLTYNSAMLHSGQVFGSGTISLTRLAAIGGSACVENPLNGNYMLALTDEGEVATGQLIVFYDGYGAFFATSDYVGATGFGIFVRNGDRFTFSGDVFYMSGPGTRPVFIEGDLTRDGLVGSGGGEDVVASRMEASLATLVTPDEIAGTWRVDNLQYGYEGTIQITRSGVVSGQVASGCAISGAVVFPSPGLNQLWFGGDTTGCADATWVSAAGTYDSDEDSFTFFGATQYAGFVWFATRQ